MTAAESFPWVLDHAGNSLHRDGVDQRLVTDAKSLGTLGAIIADESVVGGQPAVAGGTAPVDTDQDGIPDFYETAIGTNPNVADNNGDYDLDGYTNIEHYLNWLVGPHARVVSGSLVDVGLGQYTSSFAANLYRLRGDSWNSHASG